VTVAHHQALASRVDHTSVRLEIGAALALQRDRDHVARRQPAQLVQVHHPLVVASLGRRRVHTLVCGHALLSTSGVLLPAGSNRRLELELVREGTPPSSLSPSSTTSGYSSAGCGSSPCR